MNEEQSSLFESETEEEKAFRIWILMLNDVFAKWNISSDSILFRQLSTYSSVYLLNENHLLFSMRLRGKTWYVAIAGTYANLIPAEFHISTTKSNPGIIRVHIKKTEDIRALTPALNSILISELSHYHTFDCCSRYEACSDARQCTHPDPEVSLGCYYKRNLMAGRIFYGKNKNI